MKMLKAPFSFDGRIRRWEFLLSIVISVICIWAVAALFGVTNFRDLLGLGYQNVEVSPLGKFVFLLVCLANYWFLLAQGAKRLHDMDKTGWMVLIYFVPIIGGIFVFYLLFSEGTFGPNDYGPDPRGRAFFKEESADDNDK